MKNRLNKLLFITLTLFLSFTNFFVYGENNDLTFTAQTIITTKNNIVNAEGDVEIVDDKSLIIKSENLSFNKETQIYIIENNVILIDDLNKIKLKSNKIIYEKNNNLFKSIGFTEIIKDEIYSFESTDIYFDRNNRFIFSDKNSVFKDKNSNTLELDGFNVIIDENLLRSKFTKFVDKDKNIFEINNFNYNFNLENFLGRDVSLNNDNFILGEKNFLPRMKGRSISNDKNFSTVKKAVYTNCKKTDGCPPWLMTAEEIIHDKESKTINYKNTLLKLYDIPIMYFPKFFHPDPTVKRRSGFLTPTFSAEKNSGNYLNIPYFLALAENRDITFSPRIYDNDQVLYQSEYRHNTKNSKNIIDVSIKNDSVFLTDNSSTKSHFFLDTEIDTNLSLFDFSNLNLQIQSTSSDNYLKAYDIKSPIVDSQTTMLSKLAFEGSNENLDFLLSTEVYEDLSKKNTSDRYEYIFPNLEISKEFETEMEGSLTFDNNGYFKQYDTDINETILINNLTYKSLDKISENGFITNFEILFKNFNSEANNFKKFKNETESNLSSIYQISTKLPMAKEGKRYNSSVTPIFVAKFNPFPSKNINSNENLIDYTNIYSINRIGSNETLEGGQSFTIGNEFSIYEKNNNKKEIFNFNLATSISDDENTDLPTKSSLNQKSSNIVGQIKMNANEYLDLDYDFLIDNNIEQFNYHKVKSKFSINNFISSFEFIEENNFIGKESYVANETSYKIDENKDLKFRTRKNKKTNLTEYYNLIYQYKMDCLTAGLEYKKDYYSDGSLKPKEKIFFSITIMPFNNKLNTPSIDK